MIFYLLPKEYLADIVLQTMDNVDKLDGLSIPQYFTELYTLLNRAKELKSSDVTHVTQ